MLLGLVRKCDCLGFVGVFSTYSIKKRQFYWTEMTIMTLMLPITKYSKFLRNTYETKREQLNINKTNKQKHCRNISKIHQKSLLPLRPNYNRSLSLLGTPLQSRVTRLN